MGGLGLKQKVQGIGKKINNQIQLGKKVNVGRQFNNASQTVNRAVQALTPLEKLPVIGTGVKILTGITGASANISNFAQGEINKRNNKRSSGNNSLERSTVMPREEEEPSQLFV